ncbi:ATP-binding cassette domain-containing protein [Georgenia sp. MJ170]
MLVHPARTVGAVLDSARSHPGSTGRDHLRTYAALSGIARPRVDEVIDLVDMGGFADRRTGGFSTGMRQRLHLATALLGDPPILLLDEPGNGLDPAGTAWLHRFLADCAAEGRTVLVSSHVLAELEEVAHDVVLIDQGRLVSAASLPEVRGAHRTLTESFLALTGGTT